MINTVENKEETRFSGEDPDIQGPRDELSVA